MTTNLEVAHTIQQQIGQRAFFMMGAKDLVGTENSLSWRIGRNAKSISHVEVVLDPSDTYTVRFKRIRMSKGDIKITIVSESSDVYVDSLHTVIEEATGLYLSL